MKINFLFLVPLLCALFTSCEKEETEIDTQKPSIEMSFMEAFRTTATLYTLASHLLSKRFLPTIKNWVVTA